MEWQQTSGVWIRGILQDEYNVPIERIRWIRFREERQGKLELKKFKVESTPDQDPENADKRAGESLEAGELDALIVARPPQTFRTSIRVKRLFDDCVGEESRYYSKTGIFPIMHTVIIQSGIYQRNQWIVQSLFQAFEHAKEIGYKYLEASGDRIGAVWLKSILERQAKIMGRDIYPYGLSENRKTIDTLIRYQVEQEILEKAIDPETLFA